MWTAHGRPEGRVVTNLCGPERRVQRGGAGFRSAPPAGRVHAAREWFACGHTAVRALVITDPVDRSAWGLSPRVRKWTAARRYRRAVFVPPRGGGSSPP